MISSPSDTEDIDFEPDDEMGDIGALKAKIQKLRDELIEVKKERGEYLDGWQRSKADMVNTKKDSAEALKRASTSGKETLIEDLLPALDGFDMAMGSESWHEVDAAWRKGVESIRAHIASVLKVHGIELLGAIGEVFDPTLHEAVQEIEGAGKSHTIAKILRSGYISSGRVLRPAQVIIFK